MIVLDGSIVYVALPSIRQDLGFSEASLTWVVNAFTLAYGGCLLLGGGLGDLYGRRRIFLIGIAFFTLASAGCGLAHSSALLVVGRAAQGIGGAIAAAVALSLIMDLFPDRIDRTKALGVHILISAGGGSAGLLLGGVLTSVLSWHWIFLVNLPVGTTVYMLCSSRLPKVQAKTGDTRLDVWGAITITVSLVLGVYAIVNGDHAGWFTAETLGLVVSSAASLTAFLIIESRVKKPLVPLKFATSRDMLVSNAVRILWTAGAAGSFFIALYIQLVLGYGPMQVGLMFLPASLITAGFSLAHSAKVLTRLGIRGPLCIGLVLAAIGMALLARIPVDGDIMIDIVPGTVLIAVGGGVASVPLLLATMNGIAPRDTGLASGMINTVAMMGSALGLAMLVSFSSVRTESLLAIGTPNAAALTGGYRLAFMLAAAWMGAAALISAVLLTRGGGAGLEKVGPVPPTQDVA
jgi:EmrB/QacA subfamily drug resistance transporter